MRGYYAGQAFVLGMHLRIYGCILPHVSPHSLHVRSIIRVYVDKMLWALGSVSTASLEHGQGIIKHGMIRG